jgi:hypothetical protein
VREFFHQAAIALGLLERGEILALDVLDEGDLEGVAIVELLDDDRHFMKLRELRGAPAPLAGDDLVGVGSLGMAAHEERLQHALLADRVGKRAQRVVIEAAARLKPSRPQQLDRDGLRRALPIMRRDILALLAEQRGKPAAEIAALAVFAHRIISFDDAIGHARTWSRWAFSRRRTSLARWI